MAGVEPGALGSVLRNEPGRQAKGEVLEADIDGAILDVTIDGYSVVRFEGGLILSVTCDQRSISNSSSPLNAN